MIKTTCDLKYSSVSTTTIPVAEETVIISSSVLTAQQKRDALQAQITAIEVTSLENRKWREYSVIEMEKAAIAYGAAQVPALTAAASLAYAYATNIAYKKTKDVDNQIIALRTQMDQIV